MNTNGRRAKLREPDVAGSVSGLAHDALELAELQAELLICDIKRTGERARTSLLLTIVGACILLGSVPIGLIALAELFVARFQWSPAGAYAIAMSVGLVLSTLAFGLAYASFRSGIVTLDRSREELSRNVAWMKTQLGTSRHSSGGISTF